ncbi:BTAD domain-containing putative transcriptional regulator [Kitasatospora purpeofusca]|uniref:AfsR/SARP family transcriptional regulator n=1 Tax=Kitasatospora purpeofusca TaxID=67352 RepID=UPI00099BF011|nr:AfsR/SARP family transcriptional regulator [Kitasatospora purpeofusca]
MMVTSERPPTCDLRDSTPRGVAFQLLGPLEIVVGSAEVLLPQRKLRQLLAALLIRPNATVSNEALIRELWGDEPPATALAALRVYVSQLRKFLVRCDLGGRWCTLHTRAPGYQLQVNEGILDTVCFDRLCVLAAESASMGHHELASRQYREALGLRRGPTLEGLRESSALSGTALQYDEAWLSALKRRIDLDLQLGRHLELIGELSRLAAENPLSEGFCARLMAVLHRSGRSGDALAAYRRTRAQLIEELGIEPGLELRTAHQAVLADDRVFHASLRASA